MNKLPIIEISEWDEELTAREEETRELLNVQARNLGEIDAEA